MADWETTAEGSEAVAQARDGSVQAFERLYRQHAERVHALCLRLTGNAAIAEELTQDAFVRAWEKLRSFRGDSAFGTWLCRIAINLSLTRLRTDLRRSAYELGEPVQESARRVGGPDPGVRMDLEQAIALLPTCARTVFVLHDIEGYRHEEIAEQTGIATGTSKAHLHTARRRLREVLER